MNAETETVLAASAAPGPSAAVDPRWRLGLPLFVGAIVVILAIHWPTVESIVAIWNRSETFAHGFLIVPIVLVLIWQRRRTLAMLKPSPDALGLVLLACAGAIWLVAYAGEVQVVEQLALIASFSVGVLFACLSYRRPWKRLLFAARSIIVPIIANGFRAYLIVMIAHLSDNRLAHGIDHFIYGWVFFGLVMLLLFWIGSFWRDLDAAQPGGAPRASPSTQTGTRAIFAGYVVISVALAAAWPAYAAYLDREDTAGSQPALRLVAPAGAGGWVADPAPLTDWRPHYDPASATIFQVYSKG